MSQSKSMFFRLWLRSLAVKRPQSALAFAALALGATVASLLMNLYGDARRKMQDEFRAYGPNVILLPAQTEALVSDLPANSTSLMDEAELARIETLSHALDSATSRTLAVPVLYAVATIRPANNPSVPASTLVATGSDFASLRLLNPAWKLNGEIDDRAGCLLGLHAADRLGLRAGDSIVLSSPGSASGASSGAKSANPVDCRITGLISSGSAEDDQVFLPLGHLQQITNLEGSISLVEMRVSGTPTDVESAAQSFSRAFPELDVRPVREIVRSEGRLLTILRALIAWLAAIIIGVVALCVTATVTAIVLERRKEIAVMKALGASERIVSSLLLTEIGALGVAGGLAGFSVGAFLARRLGLDLFGVTLRVDWATLLPVLAAAVLVAALPALVPVSTVRSVDPARALRGE